MNRQPPIAQPWIRFAAYIIDAVLLLVGSSIAASLFASTGADGKLILAPINVLVVFLVNMAYYTAFLSGRWQATPGARAMHIYVVRTDGRKLTQRDALERFLAYVLPSLPLYASFLPETIAPMLVIWLHIFWFAPILIQPDRIGIHDKLSATRVVEGQPA